jgi:hypothetical protein
MSVSQTSNTPPPNSSYEDDSSNIDEQQQEELAVQDSLTGQENTYGNQPQNVTRDQIIQLYRKIQQIGPSNQKEILATLDDALHLLADGDGSNDINPGIRAIYQEMGGDKLMAGESEKTAPASIPPKTPNPTPKRRYLKYSGYKLDVSIRVERTTAKSMLPER